jgi:hypothetical protein
LLSSSRILFHCLLLPPHSVHLLLLQLHFSL